MLPSYSEGALMKSLFISGQYSDLTILCDGKEFAVHKNIVCTQSDYLRQLLEGQLKADGRNVIELKYERACAVERLLAWLYTRDFSLAEHFKDVGCCKADKNIPGEFVFYNALELYVLADSFWLGELRKDAGQLILTWISQCQDFTVFSDAMDHLENRVDLEDKEYRTEVAGTAAERVQFFMGHNEDIKEKLGTQSLMVQAFGILHAHEHSPTRGSPKKNRGTQTATAEKSN